MIICDPREANLFETLASLLVKLILELAKLAAAVGAKAVQMSRVCQGHRMSLTAGNRNDFLIRKGLHPGRVGLVGLVFGVFRQVTDIVETKLP